VCEPGDTNLIHFDELTWPEVANLPRSMPIVLPLGDLLNQQAAGGWAEPWALLPAIPYGWEGSPLAVSPEIFMRVLKNLFSTLREDGFEQLFLSHPDHLNVDLTGVESLPFRDEPAKEINTDPQKVLLIPLGHTEQHGYHLPLSTDTVIIDAIAKGTCKLTPESATALPVFPFGVSTHRRSFAGTFNLGGREYEDLLLEIIAALYTKGVRCFYLLNGHGGNHSFLVNVVKFAGERFPDAFTATAWLHTSGAIGSLALEQHRRSARGGMGHAGELETAMMLHLRPDLVHMDRVDDEVDFIANDHYYMDWIEGGDLIANPPWSDDTQTGSYGAGSLATAENGERWLSAAIEEKTAHVHAILDQHARRSARRIRARKQD